MCGLTLSVTLVGPSPLLAFSPFLGDCFASLSAEELSGTMLQIVLPFAVVNITIWPGLRTLTLHLAVNELSLVLRSIRPRHLSGTVNVVIGKLTFIGFTAVSEVINSLTMELAFDKVTLIRIVVILESTLASLLALLEITYVFDGVVVPCFAAFTMVNIVKPLSFVHRPIGVNEDALSVGFAVFPFSLVNVAI